MNFKEPSSKILRWKIQLMEYDFDMIYKKGSQNVIADALSRIDHEVHTNEVVATDIATNTITNIQIPITEEPINDFNLQIVMQGGQTTEQKIIIPFKNKLRKYFRETMFTKENVERILKATLKPKKIYAIFTTDDIFKIVQEVYAQNFPQDKTFTLVRSLELLPEEKHKAKQEEIINKDHQNRNHRGIDESYLHLKREIYFPNMKSMIGDVIKNCEICLRLKYDRQPSKVPYQTPETPSAPL